MPDFFAKIIPVHLQEKSQSVEPGQDHLHFGPKPGTITPICPEKGDKDLKQLAVIFDLDGTLTDSEEGVINCVQLALHRLGIPWEDREALRVCVGPPLRQSFPWFGVPADRVEEAVAIYRSRYNTVGKYENTPYPGIRALLDRLRAAGFSLYVGTSKPEAMALDILEHFGLADCFARICGADFAGTRDSKRDVLAYLLETIPRDARPIMVGDTVYDVAGAAELQIPTIGVTWGFGTARELEEAGAIAIVDTMDALYDQILALEP